MGVAALVMAGDKESRMGSTIKKPLVTVDGSTMLEPVVDALKCAVGVEEVYVATSPNTHRTEELAKRLGLRSSGQVAEAT
ncbi:MAG: NTP transferase domain-containing protein [Candidatus Bathyarchaeia archaeon]